MTSRRPSRWSRGWGRTTRTARCSRWREGDSATVARLLGEAARAVPARAEVLNAVWQIGEWLERPAVAEPFARAAAARPERRRAATPRWPRIWSRQGRWTAADSALPPRRRRGRRPGAARGSSAGSLAALPFLAVPRAGARGHPARISRPGTRRRTGLAGAAAPRPPWCPRSRLYALGLLAVAARRGGGGARAAAAQLEALPASDPGAGPSPLARGRGAGRCGARARAARPTRSRRSTAVRGDVPLDLSGIAPFSEDYARFLRGEALLALGNDAEAQRWLENGFGGTPDVMTFRAQAAVPPGRHLRARRASGRRPSTLRALRAAVGARATRRSGRRWTMRGHGWRG